MPTFGIRPEQLVTSQSGDPLTGAPVEVYDTKADAQARTNVVASTTSNVGQWPLELDRQQVWVRTVVGGIAQIYLVAEPATQADVSAAVDAAVGPVQQQVDAHALELADKAPQAALDDVVADLQQRATAQSLQAVDARVQSAEQALAGRLSDTSLNSTYATAGTEATQRLMALLANESRDASALFVGDSTGNETTEWIYRLTQSVAADYPRWTVLYRIWNDTNQSYDAAVTVQTGTSTRTLTVYNASVAGATTTYWQGPRYSNAIAALSPDLTVISLGHNEQIVNADVWHSRYVGLTEQVASRLAMSPLLLIAQNPQPANTYQQQRREVYREIAAARGYGFIDVCKAFEDYGADLTVDGTHPNATGSQLWADTVKPAFRYQARVQPRPQPVSPLLLRGDNLLSNGTFSLMSGALPDDWAGANVTAARDTANYESATINRLTGGGTPSPLAVKFTATGAGQATLSQFIPLNRARGHWLTLAVRMYVPTGQSANVGRMGLKDSTGSTLHFQEANPFGIFRWCVVSRFIPATATYAQVFCYIDSGATGTGNVTIDRASLVIGKYPMAAA